MRRIFIFLSVILMIPMAALSFAQGWRQATEKELAALIPDRAPVEKERIETELRTASGATDGKGHFIAGVVIITAGYAADGKYSHFFIVQTPIKLGELSLDAGNYVFGHKRLDEDNLEVKFYAAATGKYIGAVKAVRQSKSGPIRSLLIAPTSAGKGIFQVGRFGCEYTLEKAK